MPNSSTMSSEVDAHAAVQVVLGPGLPQVLHQVRRARKLDGLESQCHGQVCLAHAGRAQEQDVAGFGYEGQVGQLLDLALSMEGWKPKSNCSRVRWKGRCAILVLVVR